jgi:DNA polymerase III alpha subunit
LGEGLRILGALLPLQGLDLRLQGLNPLLGLLRHGALQGALDDKVTARPRADIVIGRQRPDTASGVVFVTLEDETGCVNVIVWRDLGERQRRELLSARLMTVYGSVEREGEVVHVIARRLADHSELLGRLATQSRDFH